MLETRPLKNKFMKNLIASMLMCLLSAAVTAQDKKIEFSAPKVYPEGIAYHPGKNVYYVSSVTTGTIGVVDAGGKYNVFHKDSTLKSSFGMKVDTKRNTLWVCTADPNYSQFSDSTTFKKISKIIGVDLTTAKRKSEIDLASLLPGKHFANDVTLDNKGNLYVTDSYAPVIYKVDAKNKATILAKNDLFRSCDVGLNGIVFHPQGFLIAVNNGAGSILKIDLKDPTKVSKVKVKQFFPGADGLILDSSNNLVLVQNKGVNKAFRLTSKDMWTSAEVIGSTDVEARFQQPTTATLVNTEVFILNSKMNELSDSTRNPSTSYSIQMAKFSR
jgi:sugar lactone lactonase YvrE